jgi:cellulose synthase operon protein YhjQ
MPFVCFASPKGGVGKTTLTANVGVALHRLGWSVLAIDFDLQNALRSHFELPTGAGRGIANAVDRERDWTSLVVAAQSGVRLIPFGAAPVATGMALTTYAAAHPGWLRRRLSPFLAEPNLVVVADMPPGPSPFLSELWQIADLALAVLLADAASLALLPKIRSGEFFLDIHSGRRDRLGYILNQIDQRHQLGRDVLALSEQILDSDLYGTVHRDESVAEAVACRMSVLDYAPNSVASSDLVQIARRVAHRLSTSTAGRSSHP